jgi:hypothetical protein
VTLGGIGAVAWTNYVPPLTECVGTVGGGLELLIRSEAHIFPIALLAKIPEPDECLAADSPETSTMMEKGIVDTRARNHGLPPANSWAGLVISKCLLNGFMCCCTYQAGLSFLDFIFSIKK